MNRRKMIRRYALAEKIHERWRLFVILRDIQRLAGEPHYLHEKVIPSRTPAGTAEWMSR